MIYIEGNLGSLFGSDHGKEAAAFLALRTAVWTTFFAALATFWGVICWALARLV
jgi:hypothetical protein